MPRAFDHRMPLQGLLVRSGLQYGADFITYSDHPSRVHAEFCVLVQHTQRPSRLSWEDLEIVNRLSHQVCLPAALLHLPWPLLRCPMLKKLLMGSEAITKALPAKHSD